MTRASKLLGATGLSVLAMLGATPALAAGTTAGQTIRNEATVNFTVGGVAQTATTAADEFKVDRKINVTVAKQADATVNPGQAQATTKFKVTNTSNASLDFALSVVQPTTDKYDVTSAEIYLDDGDGIFNAADKKVTYLNGLAADASATIWVVGNTPLGTVNGDTAVVQLVAEAREDDQSTTTLGAALTLSGANGKMVMDTVYADAAGTASGDGQYDAKHSASATYTVAAALLTASKSSTVITDPVNGTNAPKAIPGATISYCIAVNNGVGGLSANLVTVNDPLPANVTFDPTYTIKVGGTLNSDGTCKEDGLLVGTYDGVLRRVIGTIGTIDANTARTVLFRVTVN